MLVGDWISDPSATLHAPTHVDLEVASFIRGVERSGLASGTRAQGSLGLFLEMPLELHSVRPLVPRAWVLRHNLTTYDAAYVALAEELNASLLTLDGRMARAVDRHTDVTVIGM